MNEVVEEEELITAGLRAHDNRIVWSMINDEPLPDSYGDWGAPDTSDHIDDDSDNWEDDDADLVIFPDF